MSTKMASVLMLARASGIAFTGIWAVGVNGANK
jgi:hypothetical protein